MATVRDLLKIKGKDVWSVGPDTSVLQALELMAEKNVGALVVITEGELAGIISERDFARAIARMGLCLIESPVKDFMTKDVITVGPEMTTDDCLGLMSKNKFRHLPVVAQNKMVGLISIGDVVREVISNKESTIHSLSNYIEGTDYNR
jgi:CBS domain-containing protein